MCCFTADQLNFCRTSFPDSNPTILLPIMVCFRLHTQSSSDGDPCFNRMSCIQKSTTSSGNLGIHFWLFSRYLLPGGLLRNPLCANQNLGVGCLYRRKQRQQGEPGYRLHAIQLDDQVALRSVLPRPSPDVRRKSFRDSFAFAEISYIRQPAASYRR